MLNRKRVFLDFRFFLFLIKDCKNEIKLVYFLVFFFMNNLIYKDLFFFSKVCILFINVFRIIDVFKL